MPRVFTVWPLKKKFATDTEVGVDQSKVPSSAEGLCDTFQVLG